MNKAVIGILICVTGRKYENIGFWIRVGTVFSIPMAVSAVKKVKIALCFVFFVTDLK